MPGSLSDYLENKLLDHVLGGGDFARPATVYVGLFTVAPNDAGGGTEVAGNAYARAAVTNNATNFPAASTGSKANGAAIAFPTPTGSWGTVVAYGVFDAASGGNLLFWATLLTAQAVGTGNSVSFPIGSLTLSQD